MVVVIKLGSAFFPPKAEKIKKLKKFLEGKTAAIVVGGGKRLREYLKDLEVFEISRAVLDLIGIEFSHINARVLAEIVSGIYCRTFDEAKKVVEVGRVAVTGGQFIGQSTDAVAAALAEFLNAEELLLVKEIGGIYEEDPRKNPMAKKLKRVTIDKLYEFAEALPGNYGPVDAQALRIIQRSKIPTWVIGPDFEKETGTEVVI